jgi:NAD(P)H-hydrate epimerase
MTASLAAQGLAAPKAAALGVYLHGAAGDKAAEKYSQQAMQPADIAGCVGEVFKELEDR